MDAGVIRGLGDEVRGAVLVAMARPLLVEWCRSP
jgi:hypothetical protein